MVGPDNLKTPWYGLFRSDNGEPVGSGSVTSRYVPHTTDDVLALVEAADKAFDNVEVNCYFQEGHYVFISPSKEYRKAIFGTEDNIFARVIIDAGYDGSAYRAMLGVYRDTCKNLARLHTIAGVTVSIRHTSALREKMNDLIDSFQTLTAGWENIVKTIEQMQNREVNIVDFLNAVYPQPASDAAQRAVTIHRNRTEEIFRRIQRERIKTGRGVLPSSKMVSGWEAYNAIQGYEQHVATRRASFNNEIARIIAASNDPAVKLAETLALAA